MTKGERLKLLRKEYLHITLLELGDKLGVTDANLSSIEHGRNNLTERMAKDICKLYNVDYNWLMDGAEVPIFVNAPTSIELLKEEYDLNDAEAKLVKYYVEHPDVRKYLIEEIYNLGETLKKDD